MKKKKIRADELIVAQGLKETIDEAKRYIMAGEVFTIKEEPIRTAGEKWLESTELYIKGERKYVSRGGFKLEKALEEFNLNPKGKMAIDIGSSTGGFTDAFLQYGARGVYAVDVGTNQLAWSLRSDERVVVMEKTNFRHVTRDDFSKGPIEVASIDVSFISLRLILPVLKEIIEPGEDVIALVKPQFEAKREDVGEHGIIQDSAVHRYVIEDMIEFVSKDYDVLNLAWSPITGRQGNVEFLLHLNARPEGAEERIIPQEKVDAVLNELE